MNLLYLLATISVMSYGIVFCWSSLEPKEYFYAEENIKGRFIMQSLGTYVYGIEDFDKSTSSRNLLESVLIVHRKLHIFIKNNEVLSLNTRLAKKLHVKKIRQHRSQLSPIQDFWNCGYGMVINTMSTSINDDHSRALLQVGYIQVSICRLIITEPTLTKN